MALSERARRVLLKLDSGSMIGCSDRLRVDGAAASAVLVSADHSFGLGRLSEKDVQRLEAILVKMHGKVPHAEPLRTASAAIESLKRKASEVFQVRYLTPFQSNVVAFPASTRRRSLCQAISRAISSVRAQLRQNSSLGNECRNFRRAKFSNSHGRAPRRGARANAADLRSALSLLLGAVRFVFTASFAFCRSRRPARSTPMATAMQARTYSLPTP